MNLLNINEEAPKVFYIFIGQGKNSYSQINFHNYKLNKTIVSSGFRNLTVEPDKIEDFMCGNIVYAPFIPNKTTFSSPSSHSMTVVNGYNTEYILEYIRVSDYKNYPSRFSCVYAFGDYDSCKKASKWYGWNLKNTKKFRLKKTNSVLDSCIKIAKCNMEIVTRMWNCDISTFDKNSIDRIAKAYWNGTGRVATEQLDIDTGLCTQKASDVLYEYLIEGILEEIEE